MQGEGAAVGLGWDDIKAHLPPGWEELAVERGLIGPPRPHLGAKVTSIEPVLRLVFHHAGLESSLKITTAAAAAAGVITLSAVALHKWECKLAPYLAELLGQMVESNLTFAKQQWAGYEIVLADGTTITRPGSEGTDARVLYALRLSDMSLLHYRATDAHGGETLRAFEAHPEQLWIVDRGYANPPGITALALQGADVLVRYNRGSLPLFTVKGKPFDVLAHARQLGAEGAMGDWDVQLFADEPMPIRGRLCAVRLPDSKAEEARDRVRREYGKAASAETLEAASWLLVFTTAARSRLTTEQILDLYRVRWQIELEIKRDKSIGGLSKLPNFRDDTIATWIYAKLILGQIARRLVTPQGAFPPSAVHHRRLDPKCAPDLAAPHRRHRRRVLARPQAH